MKIKGLRNAVLTLTRLCKVWIEAQGLNRLNRHVKVIVWAMGDVVHDGGEQESSWNLSWLTIR